MNEWMEVMSSRIWWTFIRLDCLAREIAELTAVDNKKTSEVVVTLPSALEKEIYLVFLI